jgi:NAD(P)-dependent dehydrogenase (short-subunit alcohol dehydrogenase family)
MSLQGKSYVVTGGASGIGKATVRKLLQLSATVHALDIASTMSYVDEASGKLYFYPNVDIGDISAVAAAFRTMGERSNTLFGLVHCAAIWRSTDLLAEDRSGAEDLWRINVMGTWNVGTEFYKYAVKAPEGVTARDPVPTTAAAVMFSSKAGVQSYPGMAGYVASKHAVVGLTKSMAMEWGPKGIRVNCIAPGLVWTPMGQPLYSESAPSPAVMKHVLRPEELADTALYLLSDASSAIVGQVMQVDGGCL